MEPVLAAFVVLIATIISVYIWNYRTVRNGEWHEDGRQMRRFVAGHWQYRDMTDSEYEDWQESARS